MAVKKLRYSVNGEWREAKTAQYMDGCDPSTGEVIAQAPQCPAAEVESAVAASFVPQSAMRILELWYDAGLPKGC